MGWPRGVGAGGETWTRVGGERAGPGGGWAGGRCQPDSRCLACITGRLVVPFAEIRNLEKAQAWEGGVEGWVCTFVAAMDDRSPCLFSSLQPLPPKRYTNTRLLKLQCKCNPRTRKVIQQLLRFLLSACTHRHTHRVES